MATLYLHIGTPKTGTTSIQAYCQTNGAVMTDRGYCYPLLPDEAPNSHNASFASFLRTYERNPDGTCKDPIEESIWRKKMDYVIAQLQKYPNVILCDECIWDCVGSAAQIKWKRLKAEADANGFAVKIIVYVRRQDQFLSSYWAQRIKSGFTAVAKMRFEQLYEQAEDWFDFDYHRHLEEIAAIFGRENMIVRVYDRKQLKDHNIIADFFDAVGLQIGDGFSDMNIAENPSLHGNALEIKRILNTLPGFNSYQIQKKMKRIALSIAEAEESRPALSVMSAGERDAFLEKYRESNRRLARDYFGDEELALFAPPGNEPPKWEPNNPYMYEDIVRFFGTAFLYQEREIEELREKFYFRRKLKRLARKKMNQLKGIVHADGEKR